MASEGRSCQACTFHAPIARECRKNAPAAVMLPGDRPGVVEVRGIFPFTKPDSWCGEYKPSLLANELPDEKPAPALELVGSPKG